MNPFRYKIKAKIGLLCAMMLIPLSAVFAQCLSGTYSIGTGGNFATIRASVDALIAKGICGPVIFKIKDGTYKEKVTIPSITGASSVNTISFTSASDDQTKVTWPENDVELPTVNLLNVTR